MLLLAATVALMAATAAAPVCTHTMTNEEYARPVTDSERALLVSSLATMAEQLYVDPAKGRDIARALRQRQAQGGYRDKTDPAQLAKSLTDDMKVVVPDQHFKVRARVIEAASAAATTAVDSPAAKRERRERFYRSAAYDGYGIRQVRILPGNVGLLSLGEFWLPAAAGDALTSAMKVIEHADAVIIDLRDSYGGHEGAAMLLISYFLRDQQLLFVETDRLSGETVQWQNVPYVPGLPTSVLPDDVPVFVLTSRRRTFSAAEMLALALQRKRGAIVIGEQTKGGAHGGDFKPLSCRFDAFVPYVSTTMDGFSWEGVGVTPNIAAPEMKALDLAYRQALTTLLKRPVRTDDDTLAREIRQEREQYLKEGLEATH